MGEKRYVSTRGKQRPIDFYDAILQGIGTDGGLLVPDFTLEQKDLKALQHLSYVDMATEIITSFVGDDAKEELRELCQKAYGNGLFPEEVVPVKQAGDVYIAELFQGPTAAFKDMALSLLPYFMTYSLKKKGEERKVMILAATSGDTGKAALEGFKDVEGTYIQVFYPEDGVSPIQKQQMVTQTGQNVDVVGIDGNFDDAQKAVKQAFQSIELKELCDQHHVFLSSANSINIGRLIPQVVYYFYAYMTLVNEKKIRLYDAVNFTIPSGNFGNCLAGVIAKKMGLPIQKFIVASNKNNILTDFFRTGKYDARREFYKTNAPAMDILVSSNLERLVYMMCEDSQKVNSYMEQLNQNGVYEISLDLLEKMGYAFDTESIIRTRYGNDEGIDGIVKEDKFGFRNIYVQAKRWNNSVGRPEIQKFLGAVAGQGGTKGLFITTSTFTNEALEYAKKQLQVKLVLVDGKMLTNLMIQYNLGVSVVKTYEIKQIDVDYFNNDLV